VAEIEGWERRVGGRCILGGVLGGVSGVLYATLSCRPKLSTAALVGANFAISSGLYSSLQESFRMMTCQESPMNSIFAGGCAGYLLGLAQYGKSRLPVAAACGFALLGGLTHCLDDAGFGAKRGFSKLLQTFDLIEKDAISDPDVVASEAPPWFERWLPLRKLTDEEYAIVKKQQDLKDAYGVGDIDTEEFHSAMTEAMIESALLKRKQLSGEKT